MRGVWKGSSKYKGTWTISGDQLCGKYPEDPSSNYCEGIAVDGADIYYLKSDGTVDEPDNPAKFATGNPKNL